VESAEEMSEKEQPGKVAPVYCMSDVMPSGGGYQVAPIPYRFPLVSFNHLSREVLDFEVSRDFYVNVLGFIEVRDPPLTPV
jgi:hypothetical protein